MAKQKSRNKANRGRMRRPALQLEQLDARILLDAQGLAISQGPIAEARAMALVPDVVLGRQVVFVDGSISGDDQLARLLGGRADVAVVGLQSDRDGLEQIAEYLRADQLSEPKCPAVNSHRLPWPRRPGSAGKRRGEYESVRHDLSRGAGNCRGGAGGRRRRVILRLQSRFR